MLPGFFVYEHHEQDIDCAGEILGLTVCQGGNLPSADNFPITPYDLKKNISSI